LYDVMRFWFDRGVDGFRIDVLWHMLKAAELPGQSTQPGAYRSEMGENAPPASTSFDRPARGAPDRRRYA